MTETASLLEILGVVVNALGMWAALYMLVKTRRRYVAVKHERNVQKDDPRLLAAWRHFRCESGRIFYHWSSFTIGVWAMFLPNGSSDYGYTVMVLRIVVGIWLTVSSLLDIRSDGKMAGILGTKRARS